MYFLPISVGYIEGKKKKKKKGGGGWRKKDHKTPAFQRILAMWINP